MVSQAEYASGFCSQFNVSLNFDLGPNGSKLWLECHPGVVRKRMLPNPTP